ncbi:DUF3126 family protein [Jiella sp. M17.18]|uniref:DUF3126 family protein n=1 Tax=Jiella sp. M17.18 TaxID=3234247 RepID=UPI0034E04B2B
MKPDEIRKLESYLKKSFKGADLEVRTLPRKADSAEVYLNEEFVGLISKDTDEGETSYHFTMTILDIDLE